MPPRSTREGGGRGGDRRHPPRPEGSGLRAGAKPRHPDPRRLCSSAPGAAVRSGAARSPISARMAARSRVLQSQSPATRSGARPLEPVRPPVKSGSWEGHLGSSLRVLPAKRLSAEGPLRRRLRRPLRSRRLLGRGRGGWRGCRARRGVRLRRPVPEGRRGRALRPAADLLRAGAKAGRRRQEGVPRFQNDVTDGGIHLAHREGFVSVEHLQALHDDTAWRPTRERCRT